MALGPEQMLRCATGHVNRPGPPGGGKYASRYGIIADGHRWRQSHEGALDAVSAPSRRPVHGMTMTTPTDQLMPRHSRSTDELRACQVRRVTWAGLVVNTFLSALKLACGVLGNSQAVVADGVHSLSDGSTDVAILIGVRYWSKPPDADHPHGHRRIETVVTMGVGLLLAAAAVAMAWRALSTISGVARSSPRMAGPGGSASVSRSEGGPVSLDVRRRQAHQVLRSHGQRVAPSVRCFQLHPGRPGSRGGQTQAGVVLP